MTVPANGWQPIATAPKDGAPILVYVPGGVRLDDEIYTWGAWRDAGGRLDVLPARWHEPDNYTDDGPGWFTIMITVSSWPGEGIDIDGVEVEPSHWMPLPAPPAEGA